MLSQYFPIFGQLLIEQSLLIIYGQLIKGSGLVQILTENKFSMIGISAGLSVVVRFKHKNFISELRGFLL